MPFFLCSPDSVGPELLLTKELVTSTLQGSSKKGRLTIREVYFRGDSASLRMVSLRVQHNNSYFQKQEKHSEVIEMEGNLRCLESLYEADVV